MRCFARCSRHVRIAARLLVLAAAGLSLVAQTRPALAVTRIQNICTIDGQMELSLRGLGLVVGLNGTGDPADSATTLRPFARYLQRSFNPVVSPNEIKNLGGVALVEITATVPRSGIARGQRIDCQVSAINGAKSLAGGMLIATPLQLAGSNEDLVMALATGSLVLEDSSTPTSARIPGGVFMEQTIDVNIVRASRQVRLLIGGPYAGYAMAREIARAVNTRFYLEARDRDIARPVSPVAVDVLIPEQYDNPVEFVALLMDIVISETATQARVVLNAKQGTIVVTGNVEISPVAIANRNLNVEIPAPFVELHNQDGRTSPQQLADLITALNRLKVPTDDIIAVLRELHSTGHLHAELIER